jgi:hypothetical protein
MVDSAPLVLLQVLSVIERQVLKQGADALETSTDLV